MFKVQFEIASSLVGKEFEDKIKYYAFVWWPARSIVQAALDNRFTVGNFIKEIKKKNKKS